MVKIELKNLKISEILVTVYHIYRKEISSFWKIQTEKKKDPIISPPSILSLYLYLLIVTQYVFIKM